MKKRLTSLFFVLCMLTGMFPAYAESAHTGHDGLTFTELTSLGGSLDAGCYYLADNITASGNITARGEVTLCLNGKILDLDGYRINCGDTLICDCTDTVTEVIRTKTAFGTLPLTAAQAPP